MKALLTEIRLYIAELFIGWAFDITSSGKLKEALARFILETFKK